MPVLHNVVLEKQIGEGGFGIVFRGVLKNEKVGSEQIVAVKTLKHIGGTDHVCLFFCWIVFCFVIIKVCHVKILFSLFFLFILLLYFNKVGGIQDEAFTEFREEVYVMSSLSHPNLVCLFGIVNKPSLGMVMEYAAVLFLFFSSFFSSFSFIPLLFLCSSFLFSPLFLFLSSLF